MMASNDYESLVNETAAILTARGVQFRPGDLWGFVTAAQPCDDTAEEFADGWQETTEANADAPQV